MFLGRVGEDLAADFLVQQGYCIEMRNWRCRLGEVDVICWDEEELVFVEVKTRTGTSIDPFVNVTAAKQRKLRRLVETYSLRFLKQPPKRIDLVGVCLQPNTQRVLKIEHLKGAV